MPVTSTLLDQAHNAIERKLFMMKAFHHPGGSQQAFLTGLAHLYNLEFIPIQLLVAECEVHPDMMEGAAECPLRVQHGRTGEHEALPRVHSHAGESQERGRA